MTTLTNTTGSKKVNITTSQSGLITAMYVQVYKNEEQVLASNEFLTMGGAKRWAIKKLKE